MLHIKKILERFLFINFGIPITKTHVVHKYFFAVNKIGIQNDGKGLEYFLSPNVKVPFLTSNKILFAGCIGASYESKKLSLEQIVNVCNNTFKSIVLIGGKNEHQMGQDIVTQTTNLNVFNFCGLMSLDQSSMLIRVAWCLPMIQE